MGRPGPECVGRKQLHNLPIIVDASDVPRKKVVAQNPGVWQPKQRLDVVQIDDRQTLRPKLRLPNMELDPGYDADIRVSPRHRLRSMDVRQEAQ